LTPDFHDILFRSFLGTPRF